MTFVCSLTKKLLIRFGSFGPDQAPRESSTRSVMWWSMAWLVLLKLVAAGEVQGVVEGGAATGAEATHGSGEFLRIVDQVGHELGRGVEAHDHGFVLARADHAGDEVDGGLLLEAEAVADAVAGIDQDGNAERQITFRGELLDGLRPLVLDHLEIVFGEIGNELAFLIGDSKEHVDAVDFQDDTGIGRLDAGGFLFRLLSHK